MDNCLNCGKELFHVQGRRKKKFCDEKCKQEHWRKQNTIPKYVQFSSFQKLKEQLDKTKEQNEKLEKQLTEILEQPQAKKELKKAVNDLMDFGMAKVNLPIDGKPNRSDFKESIDYSIALAEWKEKQKL